jgi:hypothetical protein
MSVQDEHPNPFDYLTSINESKEDLMTADNEKKYQWFLVNHFLGGTMDTVHIANEMNQRHYLDNRLQYDFLRNAIRTKRRRSKWLKADKVEHLKNVQDYFGYNRVRAKEALKLLDETQLEYIKDFLNVGGTK